MKLNKLMVILVIIFVLIMFVGAVSAADNSNGLNAVGADNRNFEVEHNSVSDALKASNSEVLGDGNTGNNWYVKAGATDGNGSQTKPFGDLQSAINNAGLQEGDTIYVMKGTYKGTSNTGLTIDKNNLKITSYDGTTTFNAEGKNQVFKITGNNVVLSGLSLTNGKATNGGALYIDGDNIQVDNCIINSNSNTNIQRGGAIYIANHENVSITNSMINSNKAKYSGGAIYNTAPNTLIANCSFYNGIANSGGGIYSDKKISIVNATMSSCKNAVVNGYGGGICLKGSDASNSVIDNVSFSSSYADQGGAIALVDCNNVTVNNCEIANSITITSVNSVENGDGAAIWMNGNDNLINNTYVHDNNAYGWGIIYIPASSTGIVINDCRFARNTCDYHGAAIYSRSDDLLVNNSYFEKNHCSKYGGAIYIGQGNHVRVENSEFVGNYAERGGAIFLGYVSSKLRCTNPVIDNCTFKDNGVFPAVFERNMTKGGAIYSWAENTTVINSNFTHNVALMGGAIVYEYGVNTLENNTFIGNIAEKYGGGAVSSTKQGDKINNCTFIDNVAQGYGGAISADYPTITNSTFKSNHANHGGAICTITANVSDCEFYDNTADDNWVVLAATKVMENNNVRQGQDVLSMNHTIYVDMKYDSKNNIAYADGYYVYCVEEDADYPRYGVLWEDLRYAQNSITEEPVGELLKILIFTNWNDESVANHKDLQSKINIITDHDYENSNDEVIQNVLKLYNEGFRVPTNNAVKILENGVVELFNFVEIITPSATQNVIGFNVSVPKMNVSKEIVNADVFVNKTVDFNITVNNTGKCNLTYIWINETDFSDGLKYLSFRSSFNWTYDNQTKIWTLNDKLSPNKTAYIILTFNVTKSGNMTNNVSVGVGNYSFGNDTVNFTVYSPNMTVMKVSLNSTVILYVGDEVAFNITVINTGDYVLGNVTVTESYLDGVEFEYLDHTDKTKWIKEGNIFTYKDNLGIGENATFIIYFKALTNGTLVNNVTARSNVTNKTNSSANVTVYNKITINVTKVWNDSDDHDGFRPQNVTFVLYADGNEYTRIDLNGTGNVWTGNFTDLPTMNSNGKEIVYTVDELSVANYTKSVVNSSLANYTIMNTYVVNFTSVNVTKVWNDSDDHDGFRPQNVTFVLYADGVENATVVLNDGNNWKGSFGNLSMYKDGKAIVYTVDELPVDNYTKSVVNDTLGNYIIMNTYVVNFTSVNVTKVWNDSDDHDGFRPQNVTFVLYADGVENATVVLNDGNNWKGSFGNLSMYKDGKAIVYTVDELPVDNYTKSVVNDTLGNYIIMNTYVVNFTSVNVTKVWNDSDDHDGFRPQNVTFVLYADGVENATVVLDDGNNWMGSFSGLSIYKDGKEIVYTVDELPVANYTKSVVNDTLGNYIIMNTYVVNFTSVNVTKVWNDSNDHDGFRPQNVTFVLYADGNEYATVVLDEGNGWMGSFSGLSIYKDGKEIVYTVDELPVANYTKSVVNDTLGNYIIMNTYVVNFTSVNVTKVWNDSDDHDGFRPQNVTFVLYADGVENATVVLDESNGWSGSFSGLSIYKDGKEIVYTVDELPVANYTKSVVNDTLGNYIIMNTYVVKFTTVNVTKVWNDNNDQDGVRPADVTVVLVADGNVVANVTLDASNDWSASFNDLPVYKDGKVIKYSVEELAVANYTSVVSNDTAYNWIVNNTHVPMVTVINVTKVWDDNNDQDGIRPANIVVELFADGVKVNETALSESNGWKGSFMNLPVYNDGKSIKYTIDEVKVDNYTSSISEDNGNFVITNAHVPAVSDINVEKIWNDSNNKDSVRPESIVVELLADGVKVNETTLSEGNDWKYTFKDLPVYNEGKLIKYAVGEVEIANYTANITQIDGGFVITNTHVIANMTVTRSTENKSDETGNTTIITVVVTNTGSTNLEEISVVQEIPEGFEIRPFENDNWVYDGEKFIYTGVLKPGESVSFDVVFYNKTANEAENKTYTPGLNVQKITLTDAKLGEITSFKIIVTNIGDCALGDIFVIEQPCDGLDFDSYEGDDWTMQDSTFFFNGVLNPGESAEFTIFFIATKVGELVNTVVAGSNATDNVTAENSTVVIENKTPDIQQNHTNKTKTVPEIPDKVVKTNVGRATGNPILALLCVLLMVGISSIRRFKK